MNQTEHSPTPGPWEAVEINHDLRRWQIVHFDERRAAHYVTNISPAYGTGTDEHEANARLIAAAPDLLEAAIDLLDNGIEWRGGVSYKLRDASNSGNGGADQRIAALRAAIRKARGEGEA